MYCRKCGSSEVTERKHPFGYDELICACGNHGTRQNAAAWAWDENNEGGKEDMSKPTEEQRAQGARLRQARQELGLTAKVAADRIQIETSTLTAMECHGQAADKRWALVTGALGINLEWVRTGEGQMFIPVPEAEKQGAGCTEGEGVGGQDGSPAMCGPDGSFLKDGLSLTEMFTPICRVCGAPAVDRVHSLCRICIEQVKIIADEIGIGGGVLPAENSHSVAVKECEVYAIETDGLSVKLSFNCQGAGLIFDTAFWPEGFEQKQVSELDLAELAFLGVVAGEIERIEGVKG